MKPRQKKGDATRKQILSVAIEHFSKNGYDQTSLQAVAEACKITHVGILYHFENKIGLFRAVVDHVLARRQRIFVESIHMKDNAHERLLKYFQGYLTWGVIHRSEAEILLLLAYFSSVNKELGETFAKLIQSEQTSIEEILLAGQREGLFEFKSPSGMLARVLQDMLLGMLVNTVAGRFVPIPPKQLKAQISMVIGKMTECGGKDA